MQKQIKILSTFLTVLILAVSCADNNPNNPNVKILNQKWEDTTYAGSGYIIAADKVDNFFSQDGKESISYTISIEEIAWNSDNKSGIIYGKYTTVPSYNPDVANKYYAIAFKDLTFNTISISGAYKQDGVYGTDTLAKAKETFTQDNGYFDFYSTYNAIK